jgi:hypothetical protein
MRQIVVKIGHPHRTAEQDKLFVEGLQAKCKGIPDGIQVYTNSWNRGWVMDFKGIERLYLAAKAARKKKPKATGKKG